MYLNSISWNSFENEVDPRRTLLVGGLSQEREELLWPHSRILTDAGISLQARGGGVLPTRLGKSRFLGYRCLETRPPSSPWKVSHTTVFTVAVRKHS